MSSFLEKSATGIVSALQEMLFAEDLAHRPGLLQRLDTRVRVLLLALFLGVALLVRLEALAGMAALVLGLARASCIPLGKFVRRIGALAFFTVLVTLPSLFLIPGEALLVFSHHPHVAVTVSGARAVATLALRVAVSTSLALLFSMTTPWPAVMGLLRRLGSTGSSLCYLLSITRRYLFLLLRRAEELLLARKSRLMGRLPAGEGRRILAGAAGALLAHTYQMSQEIALAMEARELGSHPPADATLIAPPCRGQCPYLAASRVRYVYPGNVVALDGVDLEVWPGEQLAILGANGSGKSTLLKVLDGLYLPQEGEVRFLGRPVLPGDEALARELHRRVGLVFQDPDVQLFSATVRDEVAFALLQLGLRQEEVRERVERMLSWLGLAHLKERPPYRLSEGEKRKVALASVLVHEPEVLLLDEPTNSLDSRSHAQLLEFLGEWVRQPDLHTLVLCTHDLALAREMARQVVVLSGGRVLAQGRPEEILSDEALLEEANLRVSPEFAG